MTDCNVSQLPFADGLKVAGKFCSTIARAKMREFVARRFIPRAKDDTATVTFIEFENKTYAVTAYHVIEVFRRQAEADGVYPEGFFLPALPGVFISPPFIKPPARYPHPAPDIALRQINPNKVPAGKKCFKIERSSLKFPVPYALAAGYPTALKEAIPDGGGERLKLVGVHAVAEGVGSSAASDQIQFYSEVSREQISGDVSGMSGGPVFWSDGKSYDLLGFVKEAMTESDGDSEMARVHFICQRTDYDTFAAWAAYADDTFKAPRAALSK